MSTNLAVHAISLLSRLRERTLRLAVRMTVIMLDVGEGALERGHQTIEKDLDRRVKKGRISDERSEILGRISTTSSVEDLAGAALIIEAVSVAGIAADAPLKEMLPPRGQADDGVDCGRLPGAIAAEERHAAAPRHLEGDALQDVARTVVGVDVFELKISDCLRARSKGELMAEAFINPRLQVARRAVKGGNLGACFCAKAARPIL